MERQGIGRGKAVYVYPDLSHGHLCYRLPTARDRVQQLDHFRHERVGTAVYTSCWIRTASGYYALRENTTGNFNATLGVEALRFNTTGVDNVASGTNTLRFNTTGANHTASGVNALRTNTTGSFNTALGNGAGSLLTSGSNNIYLGHLGVVSESNTLRLGSTQTRAFIKGVGGVPISGLHVTINAAGQLGVAPSSERYKQNILPLAGEESQKDLSST
jgi:hypothetical protein